MRTIYKYSLEIVDKQNIYMPKYSKIISVMVQNDIPCIWALVNDEEQLEIRTFYIRGTGHPLYEVGLNYIGSFQLLNGKFVGHLFEEAYLTKISGGI